MAKLLPCLAILCALSVSACSRPEPPQIEIQTQMVVPEVPNNNLVCPAIPIPPDPATSTQRDLAVYILELIEVAEHCKRDLAVVRAILQQAEAAVESGTLTRADFEQLETLLNG